MNKVLLMGRLTRDPEIRRTVNNNTVANFTLAVNRRYKRDNEPDADFIPVVVWGKLAEFTENYLKKGRQIVVVGKLQIRSWEAENQRHFITEVIADEIYFADSKPKEENISNKNDYIKEDTSKLIDSELEGFYEEPIDTPEDDLPF
ncbi:single-stranded DNA-binding protein [Caldicellulosiruptoraceae bacterium PP1]